jgi:hypothetical protein
MIMNWKDIEDKDNYRDVLDDASDTYKEIVNKTIKARGENQLSVLLQKQKKSSKTIFLSATPAEYELELADQIVEQIIRPTGLLDPITYVYPKTLNYEDLGKSLDLLLQKKPHLEEFMD